MKKGVLLLSLFLIFFLSFVVAEDEVIQSIDDKGYSCLQDRFDQTNCASMSTEGKIFTLLTLGECKEEILDDSNFKSNIKYTSQAILALDKVGADTSDALEWLWAQNKTPTDMIWYLEIDSSEATECTISYDNKNPTINIGVDKKIDSGDGNCLFLATGNYWLQINPDCYDKEFEISCVEDFLTTLLFKIPNDNTIHVSSETTSSQGGGTTEEKIDFLCFEKTNTCDYEGTLWATLVLDYLGSEQDISPLIFYLTTLNSVYPQYIPESFLYYLTRENEFENKLIQRQNQDGSWKAVPTNDKYYDTALALLAVPDGSTSWGKALEWLEEEQMETGCWNSNNFLDTAFILYSVWPRGVGLGGETVSTPGDSCEEMNYFCMSGVSCGGQIFEAYDCGGFDKCCSQEQAIETCEDLNGEICNSNQQCSDGTTENTFDLDYGQTCCINGACETKVVEEFTCDSSGGICRIDGCNNDEEESLDTCEFGDACCIAKQEKEGSNLWIWILMFLILIALVIVGIIKRDKLREYWFRLKSNFKKSPPSAGKGRPLSRPVTPAATQRRLMQGRTPSARHPQVRRPSRIARPSSRAPSEINDVLKKLKDLGK
jgi:hypothetical protein